MEGFSFIDDKGTFRLKDPDNYSYLYFPVGSAENGMMGSVTPQLGGDLIAEYILPGARIIG